MQARQRKIFLIDKRFQFKFAFFVCSWIFVLSLLYPLIINGMFEMMLQWLVNPPKATGLTGAEIDQVRRQVITLLIVMQALVVAVTFLLSIFLSHRIAGPLYKLKMYFRKLGSGDLSEDVRFRKNDHFKDVAYEYNAMVASLRERNQKVLEAVQKALPQSQGEARQALESAEKILNPPQQLTPSN